MSEVWSTPDLQGIKTLNIDVGAKRTLRGKRRRRSVSETPGSLAMLAEEQKGVIRAWIKGSSSRRKWNNLLATSGFANILLAEELLRTLLEASWIEVEEHRTQRGWETVWVDFLAYEDLREHLGLSNRDKEKAQADNLGGDFATDDLRVSAAQLDALSAATKIKRHELLSSLDGWIQEGIQGTRRDFSLFARGRTKDITSAEWDWLESQLDLASFGIVTHTPLVRIKIPGALVFPEGQVDFRLLPSFVALTEGQILRATGFQGELSCWKVVENLTSFERVVGSSGEKEGVIWVPGFAPSWWVRSVTHLLAMARAPGMISCDPDPAGLLIASQVGEVWKQQKVAWEPWFMNPKDFEGKGILISMTDPDLGLLKTFNARGCNHPGLVELARWLEKHNKKLEQESFVQ
jgi:hypothetical protein